MFATCITNMDNSFVCGMNMSPFMFELVWRNWHNAREATGFLGELEGNACYRSATRSRVYHLRVLKAFVPPNKSRFYRLWCGGYVAYSHHLARKSTRVLLPRHVEIRCKNFGAFSLYPPAKMHSIILESVKVVTSSAEAIAKLALHGAGEY